MAISYDSDKTPEISLEVLREAAERRLHVVNVICDERGSQEGDPEGLSFIAMVPFLPRHGDRIVISDGKVCEVECALFKVVEATDDAGKLKYTLLVPNIVAYKIGSQSSQDSGLD